MLVKPTCSRCSVQLILAFSSLLIVLIATVTAVDSSQDDKLATNVDSLLEYLFKGSSDKRVDYAALRRFGLQVSSEFFKSDKYDKKCLRDKLNFDPLASSKPKTEALDKNQVVSAYLIDLVSSCLISPKSALTASPHDHDHDHDHDHTHAHTDKVEQPKSTTSKHFKWLAAFTAATIISVVGVFCVAVVPLLNKFCFDYLFQFLVALAIGTLTGDAMLHLIPHAFVEHHEENDNAEHSDSNIYKGLGTLTGIYVFFLIEKLMKIRQQRKEDRKQKKKLTSTPKYKEVDTSMPDSNGNSRIMISAESADENEEDSSVYENFRPVKPVKQIASPDKTANHKENHKPKALANNNHTHSHHAHNNHGHGHLHSHNKGAIKTNAWMVIMGDGLHNFSDGLAIGASFANSITAGIGTTIAIFFHELPHEIGDFALLRKFGVSLKRAIFFNVLSSVLCFLGILLGLLIGGLSFISNWSFLFIAGVFLYISLVDMLPELSANGENIFEFLLHNLGFIVGVGIMLVIALNEHKLSKLLQPLIPTNQNEKSSNSNNLL